MKFEYFDKVLDKHKDQIDKDKYDRYKWLLYYISIVTSNIGGNVSIDSDDITPEEFDKFPVKDQISCVIDITNAVFVNVICKMVVIFRLSFKILGNKRLNDEDVTFIVTYLTIKCLGKYLSDDKLDIESYMRLTFNKKFNKSRSKSEELALPVDMIYAISDMLTSGINSYKTSKDIKANLDKIIVFITDKVRERHKINTQSRIN